MGFSVNGKNIALDARDRCADTNFVSHAHSDHTSGVSTKKETLASDITYELIKLRTGKSTKRCSAPSGSKLLNAGHILGSKQLFAQSDDGYSFVYSGDYQVSGSLVAESIEIKNADVLIIDSTYPDKNIVFDEKEEVITAIQHYISAKLDKGVVLFGAYALGKAQELVKIANEAGVAPFVSSKIFTINSVYKKFGVHLDYEIMTDACNEGNTSLPGKNFMGIVDMHTLNDTARMLAKHDMRVFTAVATGFAKAFSMGTSVRFPLSDHADFKQATDYIDQCSPKVIYTYGSKDNQRIFAENLSSEGYNTHPFYENFNGMSLDVEATLLQGANQNTRNKIK